MYALVHNNQVIITQEFWNTRMFNMTLEEEFNIKRRVLLAEENDVPLTIDEDTKVLNYYEVKPDYNARIEWLDGPIYEILSDSVVATYIKKPLDMSIAKDNLKKLLPQARYSKEVKLLNISVQDELHTIKTDRETRTLLSTKLDTIGEGTVNWKFGDKWLTLNKSEIEEIMRQIDQQVQHAFDWEYAKTLEIDACETLDDIEKIKIYMPPRNLSLRGI
jgi:hypothetical protein